MAIFGAIEIISEYICIIILIHLYAKKRIEIKLSRMVISTLYCTTMIYFQIEEWVVLRVVACILLLFYVNSLCPKWTDTLFVFCKTWLTTMLIQIIIYYVLRIVLKSALESMNSGILMNCILCVILLMIYRNKEIRLFGNTGKKDMLFVPLFSGLLIAVLYIMGKSEMVNMREVGIVFCGVLVISMSLSMWFHEINERELREKEIRLNKIYSKSFHGAIESMRRRQHEYNNHLTALKGLTYTASDLQDLKERQENYISSIQDAGSFDRLLGAAIDPLMKGFLYSKLLEAKDKNIIVEYSIMYIDKTNHIPISEQIELLGVLLDNAIEALEKRGCGKLIVDIMANDSDVVCIAISNSSDRLKNSEIEQMLHDGYSTKGKARGVGLSRVREIVSLNHLNLSVDNVIRNNENHLRFSIYAEE